MHSHGMIPTSVVCWYLVCRSKFHSSAFSASTLMGVRARCASCSSADSTFASVGSTTALLERVRGMAAGKGRAPAEGSPFRSGGAPAAHKVPAAIKSTLPTFTYEVLAPRYLGVRFFNKKFIHFYLRATSTGSPGTAQSASSLSYSRARPRTYLELVPSPG